MFKNFFKTNDSDKEIKNVTALSWKSLQSEAQLEDIKAQSNVRLQIIYKHSSSCGISSMVLRQLEKSLIEFNSRADFHFLDLLSFRDVSNEVASRFQVNHQSPQLILLKNENVVAHDSHYDLLQLSIEKYI
ncbi:bacillithiol system redox-active protein YtxJ [Flavobacteriaceae bacterium]|nr:bacillithiol system redox-active protein YtxJ [Flavobacteriaceae bacterium]